MKEIKTDLFPGILRAGKEKGEKENGEKGGKGAGHRNVVEFTEPLPESSRERKDGPGGE